MTIHVSDWIGVRCGDTVHEKDNPRHLGRVEAINNAVTVKVRWLGSYIRLFSYLPLGDIVVVERAAAADAEISLPLRAAMPKPVPKTAEVFGPTSAHYGRKPNYYAESPKRQLERHFKEQRVHAMENIAKETKPWRVRAPKADPNARCCWVCGELGGDGFTYALKYAGFTVRPNEMAYAHPRCMAIASREALERTGKK